MTTEDSLLEVQTHQPSEVPLPVPSVASSDRDASQPIIVYSKVTAVQMRRILELSGDSLAKYFSPWFYVSLIVGGLLSAGKLVFDVFVAGGNNWIVWLKVLPFAFGIIAIPFITIWSLRRSLQKMAERKPATRYEFSTAAMVYQTQDADEISVPWESFVGYQLTRDTLVLNESSGTRFLIARSDFAADNEWETLTRQLPFLIKEQAA